MTDEVVQYIIVRKDLQMSPGKMAAQVGHGCTLVAKNLNDKVLEDNQWYSGSMTKIVLATQNREELVDLQANLDDAGIGFASVLDECRTELNMETEMGTLTCIVLFPKLKSTVQPFFKGLQLYK